MPGTNNFKVGDKVWIRRIDYGADHQQAQNTVGKGIVEITGSSFCFVRGKNGDDEQWFAEWFPVQSKRLYLIPA